MGYEDNPFYQAWEASGHDPNWNPGGGPGRYTVGGGSAGGGSYGPINQDGPGEVPATVFGTQQPGFTSSGRPSFGADLSFLFGGGDGFGGGGGFGGAPFGLGENLPGGGGFSDAIEGVLPQVYADTPWGGRGGGEAADPTATQGPGMGTWEKVALALQGVGSLADIYGAYQEGRARDREYESREDTRRRRQELAKVLTPYLKELMAAGPPDPVPAQSPPGGQRG